MADVFGQFLGIILIGAAPVLVIFLISRRARSSFSSITSFYSLGGMFWHFVGWSGLQSQNELAIELGYTPLPENLFDMLVANNLLGLAVVPAWAIHILIFLIRKRRAAPPQVAKVNEQSLPDDDFDFREEFESSLERKANKKPKKFRSPWSSD